MREIGYLSRWDGTAANGLNPCQTVGTEFLLGTGTDGRPCPDIILLLEQELRGDP
jgi:hypothetical protein